MSRQKAWRAKLPVATPAWPAWVAFVLSLGLAVLLCVFPVVDFDVWWHLRTGRLIVETGQIPRTDPFTFTASGRPWVTHEWLAEVLFHLVDRLGGIDLLILFKATLAAAALALSAWAGLVTRGDSLRARLPAAALGVLVAAPLLSPRAFIRPHMFTALLIAVTLLLLRLRTATGRERYRWALVPVFILWANLHAGFVLGLCLVLLYWMGEAAESRFDAQARAGSKLRPALAFLVLVAATLLNPNHYRALLYPFWLATGQETVGTIAELRSVFDVAFRGALFLKAMLVSVVLVAVAVVMSSVRFRSRVLWSMVLPGAFFLALALRSVRGVSEFSIVLPALLAAHGQVFSAGRRAAVVTSTLVAVVAVVGCIGAVLWGQPMGSDPNRRVGLGVDPRNRPETAARFLSEAAPEGRVFNVLEFGGYLIYKLWPGRTVFVDGRLDVFPPGFLRSYESMLSTGIGWDEVVERYGIEFAVVDYIDDPAGDRGLRARLRSDPEWVCVCFGDNFLVYGRRSPTNQELLKRYGSPFDPSERSEESIRSFIARASREEREQALSAIRNIVEIAPQERSPAVVLGALLEWSGQGGEAVASLRDAVRSDPSSWEARLLLVRALIQAGRAEEARGEMSAVMKMAEDHVDSWIALAELETSLGRLQEAADALEHAVSRWPGDYLAHLRLGIIKAELGSYEEARMSFDRALRIRPADPAVLKNLELLRRLQQEGRTSH